MEELKKAFEKTFKGTIEKEEMEIILQQVDRDRNGKINYSEFLAATVGGEHLTPTNLAKLFKFLDTLQEDRLTAQGLVKVFKRAGKKFEREQIQQMLSEVGCESGIDYQAFLALMTSFL